jgi:hypothetical protein
MVSSDGVDGGEIMDKDTVVIVTRAGDGYKILSLAETPSTADSPLKLQIRNTSLTELPSDLKQCQIEELPTYVDPRKTDNVYVLISTLSGTGERFIPIQLCHFKIRRLSSSL